MPLARIPPSLTTSSARRLDEPTNASDSATPIRFPTFSDLRDELAQWQDEEKMQRAIDEAKLAAVKLRTWTDKGIYSRLFDRHTNIRTENNWLFFNVEGLSSDCSSRNSDEHADRQRDGGAGFGQERSAERHRTR
jgi:hypothetical protein